MSSSSYSVWVQLYIGKKTSGSPFKIRVEGESDIDDLKKAVKEACQDDLGSLAHRKLVVYNPGGEFPKEEDKLSPGKHVPTNTTDENPIRVVAPDLLQHNTTVSC